MCVYDLSPNLGSVVYDRSDRMDGSRLESEGLTGFQTLHR